MLATLALLGLLLANPAPADLAQTATAVVTATIEAERTQDYTPYAKPIGPGELQTFRDDLVPSLL